MTQQMEFLHMQRPKPMNIGVPVTIYASTADGQLITVGTTTTDAYGNYAINWTPSAPAYTL